MNVRDGFAINFIIAISREVAIRQLLSSVIEKTEEQIEKNNKYLEEQKQ